MLYLRAIAVYLLSFYLSVHPVLAQEKALFAPGTEDVPLMEALTPLNDGIMYFDSPSGRVVESLFTTTQSAQDIFDFYSAVLPALGWEIGNEGFERDHERLTLDVGHAVAADHTGDANNETGAPIIIRMRIVPLTTASQ